ncbi:MAG: hypothetical protein IPO92_19695 [Saprospiraceae bacterium]|nr:hypothetical protein [Saprospiraceae bacterium]
MRTTIEGQQLVNNNDGISERDTFMKCSADSLHFTEFVDTVGITRNDSVKVIQKITKTNVNFAPGDGVFKIGDYTPAFAREVKLANNAMSGTLVMCFRIFFDSDNDNVLDVGECVNDSIIYRVLVNPKPTFAFTATVNGDAPQSVNNNTGSASLTLNFCAGESLTLSGYSSIPGTQVKYLEAIPSGTGNVTYSNAVIGIPRAQMELNPVPGFFAGIYGPYGLTPGTYTGTLTQTLIPYYDTDNDGKYDVGLDCLGDTITVIYNVTKPYAGRDAMACGGSSMKLTGTNPATGTWLAQTTPVNPIGATLGNTVMGMATVQFANSANGDFKFVYQDNVTGCTDTMSIAVTGLPVLETTINSVQITSNNNGVNDTIRISVCDMQLDNLKMGSFVITSLGSPQVKIEQVITGSGCTVAPWGTNISDLPGAFLGSMATASLTNPAVVGTASLKFFAFVDVNGNGGIRTRWSVAEIR